MRLRSFFAVLVVPSFVVMGACGGTGATTEEATDECTRLRNDLPACFNDAVFDQCVACHEECGRNCLLLDSCPHQFSCDE